MVLICSFAKLCKVFFLQYFQKKLFTWSLLRSRAVNISACCVDYGLACSLTLRATSSVEFFDISEEKALRQYTEVWKC